MKQYYLYTLKQTKYLCVNKMHFYACMKHILSIYFIYLK